MNKGFVYLVGAGPGDAGLITRIGYELIQKCEVLIYDRLVSSSLLDLVNEKCELIYVGKTVGNHAIKQDEINDIIVKKALENKIVVRLKGGDPFVFGRGGEEILELQKYKVPYKVIPGVTSAISGLTYAGIPITHRGKSRGFHVVTGHSNDDVSSIPNNLDILAKLDETLVFLMGFSNLDKIVTGLVKGGKNINTPVAIISNATTENQVEVRGTLGNIVEIVEKTSLKAPALIVVGEVAELDFRDTNNVLSGVNVGVTGTLDLIVKQKSLLEFFGARVFEACSLSVVEVLNSEFESQIQNIDKFNWVIFTSANSVKMFFSGIYKLQIDLRKFGKIKFAVVGCGTQDVLKSYGFNADFIPTKFSSKHLGNELVNVLDTNDKVLIPIGKKHTNDLIDIFEDNDIDFKKHIIYDIASNSAAEVKTNELDFLTFLSSTGVEEFFSSPNACISDECKVVCIGELTRVELEKRGISAIKADEADVNSLVNNIIELRGAL